MEDWAYGLLAIGIFFIIAAMFSLGRSRKKQSYGRETARDHVDRARQRQGVRDELEALMVDINRMAKDMGAQLDAKLVRIEQANREAEQRIAQLEALQHTLAHPTQQPPHEPAATEPPAIQADSLHADMHPTPPQTHPTTQADPLNKEVYSLADQGLGPSAIAEQLGEHVGKIELILALRSG